MAAVNSLSYSAKGKEVIKEALEYHDDYTIVHLATGDYCVTDEELALITGQKGHHEYSSGDIDMNILELAIEKALDDIANGKVELTDEVKEIFKETSQISSTEENESSTEGGLHSEAWYLLTGKLSKRESGENFNEQLDKFEESQNSNQNLVLGASTDPTQTKDVSDEVDWLRRIDSKSEEGVEQYYLKDIDGNEHRIGDNHAYSVKNVSGDNVTIINPWDSTDEIVITREQFIKLFGNCTLCDLSDNNPEVDGVSFNTKNNNGDNVNYEDKEIIYCDGGDQILRYTNDDGEAKCIEKYDKDGNLLSRVDLFENGGGIEYKYDENGNITSKTLCDDISYLGETHSKTFIEDENFYERLYDTNLFGCKNLTTNQIYSICREFSDNDFELARKYLFTHPDASFDEMKANMHDTSYQSINARGEAITYPEYDVEINRENGTYKVICKDENGYVVSEEIYNISNSTPKTKIDCSKNGETRIERSYNSDGTLSDEINFYPYPKGVSLTITNDQLTDLYERKLLDYEQFSGSQIKKLLDLSDEKWEIAENYLIDHPNASYEEIMDEIEKS